MTPSLAEREATRGIVVGYDGRPAADRAVDWAARHAMTSTREITLVEVAEGTPALRVPGLAGPAPLTVPAVVGDTLSRTALHRAADRVVTQFPGLEVHRLEVHGDLLSELGAVARDASLLVLGSRGEGAVRSLPSAQVGTWLARAATCPVVVVPHFRQGLVRRGVVVGVSLRKHAPEVLESAFAYADSHDLPLTIVHASRDTVRAHEDDRTRWLAEAVSGYATLHPGVRAETRVETGRPSRTLLSLAAQMDLMVVGQHTAGQSNPLGHVRSSIVDRSTCPVMVVPPPRTGRRGPS